MKGAKFTIWEWISNFVPHLNGFRFSVWIIPSITFLWSNVGLQIYSDDDVERYIDIGGDMPPVIGISVPRFMNSSPPVWDGSNPTNHVTLHITAMSHERHSVSNHRQELVLTYNKETAKLHISGILLV